MKETELSPDWDGSTNEPEASKDTDTGGTDGALHFRNTSPEATLADVDRLMERTGRKGKRGRKPKTESGGSEPQKTDSVDPSIPQMDAAAFGETLTSLYLRLLGIAARVPLIVAEDQKQPLQDSLVYCANKYIPGGWAEHVPLVGLCLLSLDIYSHSRKEWAREKRAEAEAASGKKK